MLLISASAFEAAHVTRQKYVPVDVAFNGTFHGSAHDRLRLIPVTDNTRDNAKKHLRDDSSSGAEWRRHSIAMSKSRRRRRRNSRQTGMSVIQFPFVVQFVFRRRLRAMPAINSSQSNVLTRRSYIRIMGRSAHTYTLQAAAVRPYGLSLWVYARRTQRGNRLTDTRPTLYTSVSRPVLEYDVQFGIRVCLTAAQTRRHGLCKEEFCGILCMGIATMVIISAS